MLTCILITNLLWIFIYLLNILSYQNYSDVILPKGHIALFQISRRVGSGKYITNKKFIATHNPNTGIYNFDDKDFSSLNDMLYYVYIFNIHINFM